MNHQLKVKSGSGWAVRLADGYAYTSAALCAAMGLLMIYGTSSEGPRMRQLLASSDAVLRVSNHTLLIVVGIIHLMLSVFLIVKRDPISCGAMTGWAGLNYLVYRVGMVSMGVAAPFSCVQAVAQNAGVAPATLDVWWRLVTLFYLTGACVILACEWRRWRRAKSKAFVERWREYRETPTVWVTTTQPEKSVPGEKAATNSCRPVNGYAELINKAVKGDFKFTCPNCGQHIRCELDYTGRQVHCPGCKKSITLRKPEYLKMSCFFCKGHIEFPAHAIGQKLKCPHCKMDITLKESI
jgi:hypothetical protein